MKNIWKYISSFLAGISIALFIALKIAIKKINVTNADTVIERLDQSIKKLKQDGNGNISDMSSTLNIEDKKKKRKPFLGIRLRKKNK